MLLKAFGVGILAQGSFVDTLQGQTSKSSLSLVNKQLLARGDQPLLDWKMMNICISKILDLSSNIKGRDDSAAYLRAGAYNMRVLISTGPGQLKWFWNWCIRIT